MNWEKLSFVLAAGALLASCVVSVWSWAQNRHTAGMVELDEVGDRVAKLEVQMHHLPSPESLSSLKIAVSGRLSGLEASLEATRRSLARIEDHLISKGK